MSGMPLEVQAQHAADQNVNPYFTANDGLGEPDFNKLSPPQVDHALDRNTLVAPTHINVGLLLRAQQDFIRIQHAYRKNKADLAAVAEAQEELIMAQGFVLHQFGVV